MLLRSLMFLVWAMVAASSVFWGMRLMAKPLPVPPGATVATTRLSAGADLSSLLGAKPLPAVPAAEATAPAAPESSRFQLVGVVAARHADRAQGVALIAVDGKAPRAYRVGAPVDGEWVLQSVQQRAASIGPRGGASRVSLELPPLPPPATGIPGAAAPPMAAPAAGLPGLPPGQSTPQPGMPFPPMPAATALPAVPAAQPVPGPVGGATTHPQPQSRLRAQRFGGGMSGSPPGVLPVVPAGQVEVLPNDPAAPPDPRNQR